ncbi:DNA cytosine methyltransferase [Streptomyces monticola]|uniref:Cytosine-specific methyltransferase n=1 Tax=Streptomyces monticola TaxID=2666263 RepID=A0ABW2JGX4_9ACTN
MAVADRRQYTSVEICAGAGGQAIGLHEAGFTHRALVEIDPDACATLTKNVHRIGGGKSIVHQRDLKLFTGKPDGDKPSDAHFTIGDLGLAKGEIDLLAGGVPCPPFSFAGRQLGADDERDLFPVMLEMVEALDPKAVMIENVRGLLEPKEKFAPYRAQILERLSDLGYVCRESDWSVLEAQYFGVPQLRPRAILVVMKEPYADHFAGLPHGSAADIVTARKELSRSMLARFNSLRNTEYKEAAEAACARWKDPEGKVDGVAPTLVGGSRKHGGADLGPTRAKRAWAAMGVNALGVADEDPLSNPERHLLRKEGPMLTVKQAARIQGFPSDWIFTGRKTAAYRQVGNAFPPPVARAVGERIMQAIEACESGAVPLPERAAAGVLPAQQDQQLELVPSA